MATQATFTTAPQADGRKFVTYKFVTDAGDTFYEGSLQDGAFDPNTVLASQTARWDAMLTANEISANVEIVATASGQAFSFKYSVIADARAALRQAFLTATGRRLHVIATWMDANLTNVQLQALFGLTAPQATTLRTKLQAAAARLVAFDAEQGQ